MLNFLFGSRKKKKTKGSKKRPPTRLIKMCKRYRIKCMRKIGRRRVYKSVSVLKKQLKNKLKKVKRTRRSYRSRRSYRFGVDNLEIQGKAATLNEREKKDGILSKMWKNKGKILGGAAVIGTGLLVNKARKNYNNVIEDNKGINSDKALFAAINKTTGGRVFKGANAGVVMRANFGRRSYRFGGIEDLEGLTPGQQNDIILRERQRKLEHYERQKPKFEKEINQLQNDPRNQGYFKQKGINYARNFVDKVGKAETLDDKEKNKIMLKTGALQGAIVGGSYLLYNKIKKPILDPINNKLITLETKFNNCKIVYKKPTKKYEKDPRDNIKERINNLEHAFNTKLNKFMFGENNSLPPSQYYNELSNDNLKNMGLSTAGWSTVIGGGKLLLIKREMKKINLRIKDLTEKLNEVCKK